MHQHPLDGQTHIHRHTGGLENLSSSFRLSNFIHRHTGGLEKPHRMTF